MRLFFIVLLLVVSCVATTVSYLMGFLFGKPKTYRRVLMLGDEPEDELRGLCSDEAFKRDMEQMKDYLDTTEGKIVIQLQGPFVLNRNPCAV